jgi:PBP1b-binding outer membrane lipoprotein LpoB
VRAVLIIAFLLAGCAAPKPMDWGALADYLEEQEKAQ